MARKDLIVALDIGAGSIKLGCFLPLRQGGVELVTYSVRDLDADPEHEAARAANITAALTDMMAETGVASGPVLISVSGQWVFSRFVKMPPVEREKILQMVKYEAQQNVPFPINEVVWDYQLINAGSGEVDTMIAAIKADLVEEIIAAVLAAGLTPELVDVAPMALYNAVRYNYAELPPCTMVVDMGARATDLIFIEENRVFNRSIPVGGNTITQQLMREFELPFDEAEKLKQEHAYVGFGGAYEEPASETEGRISKTVRAVMTKVHAEIVRSINFYRTQQSGAHPELILLTGGCAVMPNADEFLREKFKTQVDFFDPFNSVTVSPAIEAERVGRQAQLLGAVVGVALRRVLPCPIEINLLPPRFLEEKVFRKRQPVFLAAMAAWVLVLAVWSAYYFQMTNLGQKRLDLISAHVSTLQAVEGRLREREVKIKEFQDKVDALLSIPAHRTRWLQMLEDLRSRTPEGMWITQIRPAAPAETADPALPAGVVVPGTTPAAAAAKPITAIEIAGFAYTDKVPEIIPFRDALRASSFFAEKGTDIVVLTMPGPNDFVHDFKINATLEEPIGP